MTPPVTPYPVLDLLRERRRELGIDSMSALLGQRNRVALRGALIGAAVLGAMGLLCGAVFLRHQWIRGEIAKLEPIDAEYKTLSAQNTQREAAVRTLQARNRELANALTTVRTSSALLTDLQLRTPDGIQLSSAVVQGPSLVLKGLSVDPMAFRRINALQLELRRSPLLDPQGVNLIKSERTAQSPGASAQAVPMPVSFEISGPFALLDADRQLAVMRQLGSEGMARRLQLLQSEGLIQ